MDSTRDPEDLQTVPNPSVLVSRPNSSGPKLLELPGLPSESGVTGNMAQSFGDMGALAAVGLVAQAVDQGVLEREVATETEKAIIEKEDERDQKRLDKTNTEKEKLVYSLSRLQVSLRNSRTKISEKRDIRATIEEVQQKIDGYDKDITQIAARFELRARAAEDLAAAEPLAPGERRADETERNYLIRTGKITPFSRIPGAERSNDESGPPMPLGAISHQNLRRPGFRQASTPEKSSEEEGEVIEVQPQNHRPRPARASRIIETIDLITESESESDIESDMPPLKRRRINAGSTSGDDDFVPEKHAKRQPRKEKNKAVEIDDGFTFSETTGEGTDDDDNFLGGKEEAVVKSKKRKGRAAAKAVEAVDTRKFDDGNEKSYLARLSGWTQDRKKAREQQNGDDVEKEDKGELDEWLRPHPTESDAVFSGGLRIPGDIFPSLFDYQKVGVQWLWELHVQNAGGIVGDEMGLGKTIQTIAFIAGLHHSGLLTKPVLIIAPATVLKQWANEFHLWWPPLRVSILHSSGSGMLNVQQEEEDDDDLLENGRDVKRSRNQTGASRVVKKVFDKGHVLITSYSGLKSYEGLLLDKEWEYAILDEGHKIRNPDADISITCKRLRTHHRIILSGTPLQNNLVELWSLFDFVFPGRLGILPIFKAQIEVPIRIGGYAGATNVQVMTAQHCSEVLKELMGPYLLRRVKVDVAADLPKKSEFVLFCKLTRPQSEAYQVFLGSGEMKEVLAGNRNRLFAIDVLRKICNHPDLADRVHLKGVRDYNYGSGELSGKMRITKSLLGVWKSQGHRTLLFAQTRQMLDILERFIKNLPEGFKYRRMDGNTPVPRRQDMVDEFNDDESIDVFLLTTKVGGLGINLTGADRVIIYDPDWNPSTDMQARERAWRLGQKRPVTIYRLLTAGTIEEKIYHRQIFKQHLALKVLTDANQRLFFRSDDLHDLFSLGGSSFTGTETGTMFTGAEKVYGQNVSLPTVGSSEDDQLRSIAGVAGLEHLSDSEIAASTAAAKTVEQNLMASLFAGADLVSTLEHDSVIHASSSSSSLSSKTPLERQAIKVAQAAAKALRQSIKATQGARIGTVTWTGRNGDAGRERDDRPVVKTAAGLLATLRRQKWKPTSEPMSRAASGSRSGNGSRGISPLSGPGSTTTSLRAGGGGAVTMPSSRRSPELKVPGLAGKLREFFKGKEGKALSTEISAFGRTVVDEKDDEQMMEFRHLIKEIAAFRKGDRMWELKKEFI